MLTMIRGRIMEAFNQVQREGKGCWSNRNPQWYTSGSEFYEV